MKTEILSEDQAVKGMDYPIEVKVYKDGVQLIPSSATITIKDPGGAKKVENDNMTVDPNTGTLTYSLSSTYTANLWENALIDISYVIDSVTHKAWFLFDVVLYQLAPSVTDEDLKNYFPGITDELHEGENSYDKQIQEAFRLIKRDIKDKGKRPAMIIDGMQIRELIIIKTFELVFFDFAKNEEDIWGIRFKEMQERYNDRFNKLNIKYDEDESGTIDEDEKQRSLGQITLER